MRPPALLTVLGANLPDERRTWLLRACLHAGASGRASWDAWSRSAGDVKSAIADDRDGIKRLAPLLYANLRVNGGDIDATLLPYLRAIYAREQMRTRTYLRICEEVLGVLALADVPVVLLRGAAAAITAYEDPALRHCHDISLLVAPEHMSRAVAALREHGLELTMDRERTSSSRGVVLRHESTLPIELHSTLFEESLYTLPIEAVRMRAVDAHVGSRRTQVLAPPDALLHLCGHASYSPSRASMRWLCDAWHILQRTPQLDWELLLKTAEPARLLLPLSVLLGFLGESLDAPIPRSVLSTLREKVTETDLLERDVALRCARHAATESAQEFIRRTPGGWMVRMRLVAWLVFPSLRYVKATSSTAGDDSTAGAYLSRLGRLARTATQRARRAFSDPSR